MSDISNIPTDVQPPEGDGQGEGGAGLYQEALQAVPEHLRSVVEPHFKEWDSKVQAKFTEHADYRKQWEPYESLGVADLDPAELQELIEFRQIASDRGQFEEWYREVGDRLGLSPAQAQAAIEENDDPYAELLGEQGSEVDPSKIQELIQSGIQEAIKPLMEERQQAQYQAQLEQETKAMEAELGELAQASNVQLSDGQKQRVYQLAHAYGNSPEAIKRGFADYQTFVSDVEKGLLSQKDQQPVTAVEGGRPATQVPSVTSFEDAGSAALALLRQAANP